MTNTANTKHTPGPWPIEYDNADCRSGGQWFNVGPAQVQFSYSCTDEGEARARADANLISAAPELLAALEIFVSFLSEQYDEDLIEHADSMIRARAAISKARGEA